MQEFLNYLKYMLNHILNIDYIWGLWGLVSLLTFETLLKVIIVYFFIVWFAIVIFVTKDIINRTNNILYQIISIFTVLFWTPLWIVVYLLIRPSKTLFEKYYEESSVEEVDEKEIDEIIKQSKELCYNCKCVIELDYNFCPSCKIELKKDCFNCKKQIKPNWNICPYCWKNEEKKIEKILNKTKENKEEKEIISTKKEEKIIK